MHSNLRRFDLSAWLIHFTKALDLDSETPPELPCEWGFGEGVESTTLSPFFGLRRILRKRQILSTWSLRGKSRTVYGRTPAVCFTEMPVGAFLESGEQRAARGEHASPYGVMLSRDQVFAAGGRPVIYGLSNGSAWASNLSDGTRLFPEESLPEREQYRLVSFDPVGPRQIDWTHEREWRWPNRNFPGFRSYDIPDEDSPEHRVWKEWDAARERDRDDRDGLCLDTALFKDVGFLVKNARQARLLTHDILAMVDSGRVAPDVFRFILCREAVPGPGHLISPHAVAEAIASAQIPLSPFFDQHEQHAILRDKFETLIRQRLSRAPRGESGEFGGCWLWLTDNTSPLARAMMLAPEDERRVRVSRTGRYLVEIPELGDDRSLSQRERLVREIADLAKAEFGIEATYFSVAGSDDIDGVPFYTAWGDDIYMNYAHDQDDF